MSNAVVIQQIGETTELWSPTTFQFANPLSVLSNKVVMIYFSAYWCRPCKSFTDTLQSLYRQLKTRQDVEDFEVVFCSFDRFQAEYQAYVWTMPWLCLPMSHPQIEVLAEKYGVQAIPHLVVLDQCGKVLLSDGVKAINRDPTGIDFPWRPKLMKDLLPTFVQRKDNSMSPKSCLVDKYILLFFAASWCPISREFAPKLARAYLDLRRARDDFELLFVSLDDENEKFEAFFQEMTFCAWPYQERKASQDLLENLRIESLPAVVVLSPCPTDGSDRTLINANARPAFESGDYMSDFPFHPKHYGDLNKTSNDILQHRCVVVFHEAGDTCDQDNTKDAVRLAADRLQVLEPGLKLYWALESKGFAQQVKGALQLPLCKEALVVLLDIKNDGSYYVSHTVDVTMDSIIAFVQAPGERLNMR